MTDYLAALLAEHDDHPWSQVGPCVYCDPCRVRLYHGTLPDRKHTTPKCPDGQHEWDPDMGLGFYVICMRCGVKEWCE